MSLLQPGSPQQYQYFSWPAHAKRLPTPGSQQWISQSFSLNIDRSYGRNANDLFRKLSCNEETFYDENIFGDHLVKCVVK